MEKPSIVKTAEILNCLPQKQAGDSLYSGDCPGNHGSKGKRCFRIYPSTDSFHCFHCGRGGSSFDLIMIARNCTFPEALAFAREKGLVQGNGLPDDKSRQVYDLLTKVARWFNAQLTSSDREFLESHYGLTNDTIDQYAIGMAPMGGELAKYLTKVPTEIVEQSGLMAFKKPFFQGQIVFPYWKLGQVRYMIGRQTELNPSKGKYEKLKTTDIVKNDYFYGEDSIYNQSVVYVTEGVTDCLTALQHNLPSISPVTTQFKKSDYPKLLELVKGKAVYLIPDNEVNQAGMKGAESTLQFLTDNNVKAYIITIPRANFQVEKIDFNEYVRDYGIDSFHQIVAEQIKQHEENLISSSLSEIREWLSLQDGVFTMSELYREFGLTDKNNRTQRRILLKALVEDDTIRRVPDRPGIYKTVDKSANVIDYKNANSGNVYNVLWPLGIHQYVKLFPKNIAIIAGSSNSGKTAYLLNFALQNSTMHKIRYISSEMGPEELRSRLDLFGCNISVWDKISFYDKSSDFSSLVHPDELNIIDYLEISDNFFSIGAEIKLIYDKLKSGIAVIAIQKKSSSTYARGGEFTLEKARLYLTIDPNLVKIIKGKNWAIPGENPKDKEFPFKLVNGCDFQ